MNNLSVFPDDFTERADDVENWSCCSSTDTIEPIVEESLLKRDDDCFQTGDCDSIPTNQDESIKGGNSVEKLPVCSSTVKTKKRMSNEVFTTEDCTECDDVFHVDNVSQLPDHLNECSERGVSVLQSPNYCSTKATKPMVDEIFMEQGSSVDGDSSNGESMMNESDNGERFTVGAMSQRSSCFSNEDSDSNVVVSDHVDVSGPKTSLLVLNSNTTKRMTSKPKRVVLQVIRKPTFSDSGAKMLTYQSDCTDALEITSPSSFVSCNRNVDVSNHRSTGDESDSNADNLPHSLNKSALQARVNREKKKAYIAGLEKQIGIMKKEKYDLERKVNSLEEKSAALDDQVTYLKSVLANESVLAKLISNINGTKTAELSSSSVMGKKRKLGEDRDDRTTKLCKSSGASSGICLHVSNERLSLELCHHCAQSSAIANRSLFVMFLRCFIKP